jgi:hypothetical protein
VYDAITAPVKRVILFALLFMISNLYTGISKKKIKATTGLTPTEWTTDTPYNRFNRTEEWIKCLQNVKHYYIIHKVYLTLTGIAKKGIALIKLPLVK